MFKSIECRKFTSKDMECIFLFHLEEDEVK